MIVGERVSELTLFLNQIIKSYWWYLVVMFYHPSFSFKLEESKTTTQKSTCPTTHKGLLLFHVQKAGEQAVNICKPLGIPVGIHHPFPPPSTQLIQVWASQAAPTHGTSQGFQRCARDLEANSSIEILRSFFCYQKDSPMKSGVEKIRSWNISIIIIIIIIISSSSSSIIIIGSKLTCRRLVIQSRDHLIAWPGLFSTSIRIPNTKCFMTTRWLMTLHPPTLSRVKMKTTTIMICRKGKSFKKKTKTLHQ